MTYLMALSIIGTKKRGMIILLVNDELEKIRKEAVKHLIKGTLPTSATKKNP